jgi:integrase
MFAKDSGLRISDIGLLNVEDYLDARSSAHDGEIYKEFNPIVTKKTKAVAYSCIGPEAVNAVDLYLEERGAKRGEPLFNDHRGKRIKDSALSELFRRFGKMLDNGNRISAHSFRKFNETMMESAGIPLNWIKRYQGRKVSDSTGPYSNPQDIPDRLIEKYVQCYDSLRVFEDKRELEQVKHELSQYKGESEIMRITQHSQQTRVAELEAKLERMEKALQAIYDDTKPKE